MSGEPASRNVKICGVCGKDVSRSPRVKDEQGRYYCEGACFAKYKASLHRAAPPSPTPPPVVAPPRAAMDDLAGVNPAFLDAGPKDARTGPGMTRCPSCGFAMKDDAAICTSCGYSSKRGARLNTKLGVIKEKGEKRKGPIAVEVPAWAVALGLLALLGTTLVLSMQSDQMVMVHIGVAALVGLIVNILVIVSAFSQGHTGWGIVTIASFCVPFLGLAVLYYIFCVNDNDALKAAWLVVFVVQIASIFVHLEKYQEMTGRGRGLSSLERPAEHDVPCEAIGIGNRATAVA